MLSFLRRNSIKIVYTIVISFVVTTFLGVMFFNDSFKASKDQEQLQMDRQSAIALIGDLPISQQVYQLELRRIQATLPSDIELNNQLVEAIQLNALTRAIENTLLLSIGKSQNIDVSRAEINASLLSVMDQFNVASKKELKTQIKASGGSYEAMLNQLKNDIISAKTRQAIESSVTALDDDVSYLRNNYEVRELFISKFTTQNTVIDEEVLYQKAQAIRQQIINPETFELVFSTIYPNVNLPLSYQTVKINQLSPSIARALVSLQPNEISQPIKTLNGYHILELKSISVDDADTITKDQLNQEWARRSLFEYLANEQRGREIKILNLNLRAIKLKNEGRLDDAIAAYEGTVSQDPSNPYPNLFIAQIQLLKGDLDAAKQSLLKAEIKESLISEQVVVPEIHLLLAEIYNRENFKAKRDAQYDKLINDQTSLEILNYLKSIFEESDNSSRLNQVSELIEQKSATESIIKDSIELSDSNKDDSDASFLDSLN